MEALSVAVVGAGIGGLTTALALAARGHAVTLVERRTALSEVGAGLQLSPNASRVLVRLGLGQALRRAASEPPGVVIRRLRSGAMVGAVAMGEGMRRRYDAPYLVLRRADLQTILLDAVRAQGAIRLLVGRTLARLDDVPDGASLTLERGGGAPETLDVDLVVAADGVRSRVRDLLDRAPVRETGFAAWRALVPRTSVPEGLSGEDTGLWLGRGRHVVHYPVAGGRSVNVVAVLPGRPAAEAWDAPGEPAALQAAFRDAAPALAALLALPESWLVRPLLARATARPIARGRIALLGDAAHPVLPYLAQGAALAVEDAAVLAGTIAAATSVPAALAAYAAARERRARRVQAHAARNGRVYHAGPLVAAIRDRVLGRLGPDGLAARYDWLYGWTPENPT